MEDGLEGFGEVWCIRMTLRVGRWTVMSRSKKASVGTVEEVEYHRVKA
jgi:hypothetical protein